MRCLRVVSALALVGCGSASSATTDAGAPDAHANADAADGSLGSDDAGDSATQLIGIDLGLPSDALTCDLDALGPQPADAKRTCRCPSESPSDPALADADYAVCDTCLDLWGNDCFGVSGGPLMPPEIAS